MEYTEVLLMKENKILIETKDLKKYYPVPRKKIFEKKRYVKAVDGLNLKIPKGCTYGLVGESGCGKSTVGQVLAGIYSATDGKVFYEGEALCDLSKEKKKKIRRKIQMIFQDPYSSLNPKKKIGWILEEPLKTGAHLNKAERKNKVTEVLKQVGLEESYVNKYPNELSGGQRQRVSIAAALLLEPEFIIADEAVSALDVSVQAQILNLLRKLQRERNLTYLFISHNLNVVQFMSDYIGVMYLGHLVECGTTKEICDHPLHPYTKALLSSVVDVHDRGKKRILLEGEVPDPVQTPLGCPFHTRCSQKKECCNNEKPEWRMENENHAVWCHNLRGEK